MLKQNIALFPYQVYLSITIGMQIVIFYHAVFVSMGVQVLASRDLIFEQELR